MTTSLTLTQIDDLLAAWQAKRTTASANVKASLFIQTPNPTFTLTATALNNPGEVANAITGVSLTEEAPTVNSTVGAQAQGQFQVAAGLPCTSATGTITTDGTQPATGATVVIGSKTYRFESTMAQAYDVKIAASAALTLANLVLAVNAAGTAGTNYYAGTVANPAATASISGNVATLTAITPGTAGNTLTLTGATHLTASAATLLGGESNGISAISIGPVLATATITPSGAQIADGDTLTVGATVYRFKTTPAQEWDIQIGVALLDTLDNLILAINGTGTGGTNYYIGTPQNSQVSALATLQGGTIKLLAVAEGAAGNSIILVSSTAKLVASAGTLLGGAATVALIPATVLWQPGWTVYQFVNQVVNQINAYTATSGFYAQSAGQNVIIYSKANASYANNAITSITVSGLVAIGFCAIEFSLPVGQTSGNVTGLTIQGFATIGTVGWDTTIAQTVKDVATAFNALTALGPNGATPINQTWVAVPFGQTLYLSNIITTSQDNSQAVVVTGTNFGFSVVGQNDLTAVCNPTFLWLTQNGAGNNGTTQTPCVCVASGGYPPYTYNWVDQSALYSGVGGYSPVVNGLNSAIFQRYETTGNNGAGWYACVVTDSKGNSATSNVIGLEQ